MDDVIKNCETTFEEDGVSQQTLGDLRKVRLHIFRSCPTVLSFCANLFPHDDSSIRPEYILFIKDRTVSWFSSYLGSSVGRL